jgi:hypothetical protein
MHILIADKGINGVSIKCYILRFADFFRGFTDNPNRLTE